MMLISILRAYWVPPTMRGQGGDKPRPYPIRICYTLRHRVGAGLVPALTPRPVVEAYIFLALFLLAGLFPLMALADGGAPQLAYVAGAAQGISVIDIAQRRVSRTISIAGSPRTILLSLDGHALYVTQPALGRVTVIASSEG